MLKIKQQTRGMAGWTGRTRTETKTTGENDRKTRARQTDEPTKTKGNTETIYTLGVGRHRWSNHPGETHEETKAITREGNLTGRG